MNHCRLLRATFVVALLFPLMMFPNGLVSADTYQWVDKNGNLGFTDSIEKVPPQYRKSMKRIEGGSPPSGSPSTPPRTPPSAPNSNTAAPGGLSDDPYAVWQERMNQTRTELEDLKMKRQKAQEEHIALRRQLWYQWGFVDADIDAKVLAKISALDQQIRDKEYELSTTIPDEARRAGVPLSVLTR